MTLKPTLFMPLLALCCWALSSLALADEKADAVGRSVQVNTDRLIEILEERQGQLTSDPEAFYQVMDVEVSKFVDFPRIAARVMGQHIKATTKEQRIRFLEVFKRSFFDAYRRTVLRQTSTSAEFRVLNSQMNERSDERATVNVEIKEGSGQAFKFIYSMHQTKEGEWKLENVIAEGLNVGKIYRDRFDQLYKEQKGDIDKVIANWTSDVESPDVAES